LVEECTERSYWWFTGYGRQQVSLLGDCFGLDAHLALGLLKTDEQAPFPEYDETFEFDILGHTAFAKLGSILVAVAFVLRWTNEWHISIHSFPPDLRSALSAAENDTTRSYKLPDDVLVSIRERLFSANLIGFSKTIPSDSQPFLRFWELTDNGRQQASLLHYRFGLSKHLELKFV
jgi:hypothetical protein